MKCCNTPLIRCKTLAVFVREVTVTSAIMPRELTREHEQVLAGTMDFRVPTRTSINVQPPASSLFLSVVPGCLSVLSSLPGNLAFSPTALRCVWMCIESLFIVNTYQYMHVLKHL